MPLLKNHAAFEVDAFFLVEPEVMAMPPVEWPEPFLKGLFSHPRFIRFWRYGRITVKAEPSLFVDALIHENYLRPMLDPPRLEYRPLMVWSSGWVRLPSAP